jgi:uncharacterized protein (TIGR02145 family)
MLVAGCVKPGQPNIPFTVTDADGNQYGVISIGTQTWMAGNLRVTHYNDGTPILNITDAWDWGHTGTGAWCEYDNSATNGNVYGKLYNWYAVNTNKLAPVGWHVPTYAEWQTLEIYLGNNDSTGGRLKETGFNHWQNPNALATNERGFTALPGGSRFSTGTFSGLTYNGYWWTSSEGLSDTAYGRYRFMDFSLGGVYGTEDYKVDGLSVRCIKD